MHACMNKSNYFVKILNIYNLVPKASVEFLQLKCYFMAVVNEILKTKLGGGGGRGVLLFMPTTKKLNKSSKILRACEI